MKILDRLILKAIQELGEPSTAEIIRYVNPPSFGTFFRALDRLQDGQYITSRLTDNSPERRLCRLTEEGFVELRKQ